MKSVIDAVNHFKAVWPYSDKYNLIMSGAQGYYRGGLNSSLPADEIVCTREKFNQCVDEMTNLIPRPQPKSEMPNVGFKLKYQHEFIEDSDFQYLSDEKYGWEDGDNLEIITKRVDVDGDLVAIVLNTQEDVLSTAILRVEFFKPIDTKTNRQKIIDSISKQINGQEYMKSKLGMAEFIADILINDTVEGGTFTENDDD